MPPRVRQPLFSSQCLSSSLPHGRPSPLRPLYQPSSSSVSPSTCTSTTIQRRNASSDAGEERVAAPRRVTRLRRQMQFWMRGPGRAFKQPLPDSTNYLSAYDSGGNLLRLKGESLRPGDQLPPETSGDLRPFPLNRNFASQRVLSEELREIVWRDVVEKGLPVQVVSVAYSISTERVAAVVRLKTIEKQWVAENKPLARPYSRAVMAMLPQTLATPMGNRSSNVFHESINDLPVHPATRPQIFYPVPESRHFTREHAAKVFDPALPLLPADKRIPHPELVEVERDRLMGLSREQMEINQISRLKVAQQDKERKAAREARNQARTAVIPSQRWDFHIEDVNIDTTRKDGRHRNGIGARYGVPHQDRKRGQVKIPTKVEA